MCSVDYSPTFKLKLYLSFCAGKMLFFIVDDFACLPCVSAYYVV